MTQHSIFNRLNKTESEVRLLRLLPGRSADPIRCTVHIVSLNDNPRYEALSYVWGDETDTRSISVNNQPYSVTVNLEAALRGLRRHRGERIIWADAICINQDDNQEKNEQVPEMTRVYSQASRVLAWLGEPSDAIRAAVKWTNRYRRPGLFLRHMGRRIVSLAWPCGLSVLWHARLEMSYGYAQIFAHPYWTRMWTYQEFVICSVAPLLVWHGLSIHSDALKRSSYEALEYWDLDDSLRSGGLSTAGPRGDVGGPIAALVSWKADIGAETTTGSPAHGTYRRSKEILYSFHINQLQSDLIPARLDMLLVRTGSTRSCSNPRDYVYALYALLPDARDACPPDYNKPLREVMHDTALYLASRNTLGTAYAHYPLYEDRLCAPGDGSYQAPSWVPDLTKGAHFAEHFGRYRPSHFTSSSKLSWRLSDREEWPATKPSTGRILRTAVRNLGDWRRLLVFSAHPEEVLGQVINTLVLLSDPSADWGPWEAIRGAARWDCADRVARALFNPIIRDLQWMTHNRHKRLGQVCLENLYRLQRLMRAADTTEVSSLPSDELRDLEETVLQLAGTTIFTAMGCIGFTVEDLACTDQIVVGKGFLHPAVLRSVRGYEGRGEELKLVGFGYIDGLMENQFVDYEPIEQVVDLKIHVVEIS
jgi:hypothetical protein